jgi:hypothetical protein
VLGSDAAAAPAAAEADRDHLCGHTAPGRLPTISAPPSATLSGVTTDERSAEGKVTSRAIHATGACLARRIPQGAASGESRMTGHRSGLTVDADQMAARDWSGELVEMPSGRLHAVSDPGLIVARPCVRLQ